MSIYLSEDIIAIREVVMTCLHAFGSTGVERDRRAPAYEFATEQDVMGSCVWGEHVGIWENLSIQVLVERGSVDGRGFEVVCFMCCVVCGVIVMNFHAIMHPV